MTAQRGPKRRHPIPDMSVDRPAAVSRPRYRRSDAGAIDTGDRAARHRGPAQIDRRELLASSLASSLAAASLATALASAPSVATAAALARCACRAPIGATFVQPWAHHWRFGKPQWEALLSDLDEIGVSTIYLQWTQVAALEPLDVVPLLEACETAQMKLHIGLSNVGSRRCAVA